MKNYHNKTQIEAERHRPPMRKWVAANELLGIKLQHHYR